MEEVGPGTPGVTAGRQPGPPRFAEGLTGPPNRLSAFAGNTYLARNWGVLVGAASIWGSVSGLTRPAPCPAGSGSYAPSALPCGGRTDQTWHRTVRSPPSRPRRALPRTSSSPDEGLLSLTGLPSPGPGIPLARCCPPSPLPCSLPNSTFRKPGWLGAHEVRSRGPSTRVAQGAPPPPQVAPGHPLQSQVTVSARMAPHPAGPARC